jgi:hypothetical protein
MSDPIQTKLKEIRERGIACENTNELWRMLKLASDALEHEMETSVEVARKTTAIKRQNYLNKRRAELAAILNGK